MIRIDVDELNKHVEAGLIRKQCLYSGQTKQLEIWNYTHKAQYDRIWDEYTTLARGLITRPDGTIHARSFRKFWNLGESPGPALNTLPQEDPVITVKLDGYLGLTYEHEGVIRVASRGSFTSEYAQWATDWLHRNNPDATHGVLEPETYTFVFEILYPHRRIVVDNSGRYGLVLLAAIHNETGEELPRTQLESLARLCRWPVVPVYPTHTIEQCVALGKLLKGTEQEGFVAYYPKAGLRVKIKGDDYCTIHKTVTRLTKRRIWEILAAEGAMVAVADAKLQEIRAILPPEYAKWLDNVQFDLLAQMTKLFLRATAGKDRICRAAALQGDISRKTAVQKLQADFPDVWHEALYMLDGKTDNAVASVWKRIKPEHDIPIVKDGDDE